MSVACLFLPRFAVAVERQRHPELRGRPLILGDVPGRAARVLECSEEATARGVGPGMPLRQGTVRCPDAVLLEPDLPFYHRQFRRIVEALLERAPEVEPGPLGWAWVRLAGLEGLYRDEHALALSLLRAAPEVLEPRLGIAPTKGVARLLAVRLPSGGVQRLAPEDVPAFLNPLPASILPTSAEVLGQLASFGLRTLGALANLPMAALQAQFGPEGARLWKLARGADDDPFVPCQYRQTIEVSLSFPAPAADAQSLRLALERLVDRALSHPLVAGRCVRRATVVAHLDRGGSWPKTVVFKEAVRERRRLVLVLQRWLENGQGPPGAVEALTLTLEEMSGEVGHQMSLFRQRRRRAQLREAVEQLRARYGPNVPVYSVVEVEPWSRVPERRLALAPYNP